MSAPLGPAAVQKLAEACAVYRMFDSEGCLLYVGKTGRAGQRFGDHSAKRWFPLVSSITLEWYVSEEDAEAAERIAIRTEHPRYNVQGVNPRRGKPAPRTASWQPTPWIELPTPSVAIPDVLNVFEGERRLHWQTIASRLADKYPDRWAGVTGHLVSAKMRGLGVLSIDVREPGSGVCKGCRRVDVESVAAALAA